MIIRAQAINGIAWAINRTTEATNIKAKATNSTAWDTNRTTEAINTCITVTTAINITTLAINRT
jgi:hypothetical protein